MMLLLGSHTTIQYPHSFHGTSSPTSPNPFILDKFSHAVGQNFRSLVANGIYTDEYAYAIWQRAKSISAYENIQNWEVFVVSDMHFL